MTSMLVTVPNGAVGVPEDVVPCGSVGRVEERCSGGAVTAAALRGRSSKSHPTMVRRPRVSPKSTSITAPASLPSRLLISGSGVRVPDGAPEEEAPPVIRWGFFVSRNSPRPSKRPPRTRKDHPPLIGSAVPQRPGRATL